VIVESSPVVRLGRIAFLAAVILLVLRFEVGARDRAREWTVLNDCRLIPNPANDGDSFHVSAGGAEYLFRLYFVDTPETDEMTPRRLVDQAKYFGITVPQAIEAGREAKEFTRQKLSQPFTVVTRMSGAMGRSRIERFYAFVQTSDGDLGELLVRNGLARNYGFKTTPPGLGNSRIEQEKLQQLENQARQEKIGAWAMNFERSNVHSKPRSPFSSFVPTGTPGSTPERVNSSDLISQRSNPQVSITPSTFAAQTKAKEKTPLGRIDINTATEKELTTVPGIGHVIAFRIIAARPFRSADDLKRVSGIGEKKYAQIRPYFQ
jgi:competence protein ComEA